MGHFILSIKHTFSAARALRDYQGQCANVHGHNFTVEAKIRTPEDDKGYVLDYYEAKIYLAEISEKIDHNYLNDIPPFDTINPTTENLAKYFYEQLLPYLEGSRAIIESVTLWEMAEFAASYYPG